MDYCVRFFVEPPLKKLTDSFTFFLRDGKFYFRFVFLLGGRERTSLFSCQVRDMPPKSLFTRKCKLLKYFVAETLSYTCALKQCVISAMPFPRLSCACCLPLAVAVEYEEQRGTVAHLVGSSILTYH